MPSNPHRARLAGAALAAACLATGCAVLDVLSLSATEPVVRRFEAGPDAAWSAAVEALRARGYEVPAELQMREGRSMLRVADTRIAIEPAEPSGTRVAVSFEPPGDAGARAAEARALLDEIARRL